jgi:hypothetical protein
MATTTPNPSVEAMPNGTRGISAMLFFIPRL